MSPSPWWDGGRPVVITGGGGFLGSHLAARLSSIRPEGGRIIAVDDGTRDCFSALHRSAPPGVERLHGDVRDAGRWLPELGSPSVVVHCAALAGVSTYYTRPHDVLAVNGLGTVAVVEAAAALRPALLINLSTSEVYGAHAAGAREDGPASPGPVGDPRWTYATSKLFAESWVLHAHRAGRLRALSVRPFNVYGPGQLGEGAVRNLAEAAVLGAPLRITGDGQQSRTWCYVDDFIDAILLLAAAPQAWGRTFNIGDAERLVAVDDLAQILIEEADSPSVIEHVPHPGQDVAIRWPDTTAIRVATGWSPQVSLEEGLRRTLGFWRSHLAGPEGLASIYPPSP